MKRAVSNAFTRSECGPRNPCRSLAASLASMQVLLEPVHGGYRLELSPMAAFDAAGAWTLIDEPDLDFRPLTIVLDAELGEDDVLGDGSLDEIVARWGIGAIGLGDGALLASDTALRQIMTLSTVRSITVLRVAAPMEPMVAESIVRDIRGGADPLQDPRVRAAMTVRDDRHVVLLSRTVEEALRLVGENFRHYLAAVCDEPPATFAAVPAGVLATWLHDGGALTVRPIETEQYSTFVDIGMCPTTDPSCGPAMCSLIYDRPSGTWHGEM